MNAIVQDVGLALWRLLPANPIVLRVVQVGSKRVQHLWARIGYLLILLGVMTCIYLFSSPRGGTLADMAKSATGIFETISVLQLAMICLMAPVFTASAISQEKDAETFNVLLTTPLTNAQIVLGSLMSRLFFVLMLLLSGLPIFCITMLYGGVTARQVFLSLGIAAATAVMTGALAILISVVRVGTRGTIFSFYVGNAFFLIAGYALGQWRGTFVAASIDPITGKGMSLLALIHPFLALEVALGWTPAPDAASVAHFAWPLNRMLPAPHAAFMLLMTLLSTAMVVFSTFFVRRGIKQGEVTLLTRIGRLFSVKPPEGERRRRPRRVWSNPVAWREAVTRANAASSSLVRYGYVGLGAAAGVAYLWALLAREFSSVGDARAWLLGIVLLEFGTVLLMAVNTAATAITREREAGTMELLLTTPLTSRYIVSGKLRGLVSFALPLMAVPALTVIAVACFDGLRPAFAPDDVVSVTSAILLPPLLAVYAAFTCLLGLHLSLKSRRSVQAVLASVAILLVMGFGLFACAMAASSGPPQLGALLAPLTFVTAIVFVLNPDEMLTMSGTGARAEVEFLMAVGTAIALGLYGAIVAGTYRSMVTNFDMIVRKQSK
ncbi:MAG: hypothetical protein AMXMBFR83_04190 [Phycisphaerae bacterium]